MITVKVKKLHEDAVIPKKAYTDDSGFDLHALEDIVIEPGKTIKIRTGLAFELPVGYEMQIRPRSGISIKTKLRVNLGTVDNQYRGEVNIVVDNVESYFGLGSGYYRTLDGLSSQTHGGDDIFEGAYIICKGERIAQAVIQKIPHIVLYEVDKLSDSRRGDNGFGSSGV